MGLEVWGYPASTHINFHPQKNTVASLRCFESETESESESVHVYLCEGDMDGVVDMKNNRDIPQPFSSDPSEQSCLKSHT